MRHLRGREHSVETYQRIARCVCCARIDGRLELLAEAQAHSSCSGDKCDQPERERRPPMYGQHAFKAHCTSPSAETSSATVSTCSVRTFFFESANVFHA